MGNAVIIPPRSFARQGVSLTELLVVIAIIGILVGLLLPVIQSIRESARRVVCQNHLRQLGLAMLSYESSHGTFPPGAKFSLKGSWSVHGRLLPYMEQANAYSKIRLDLVWHDPINLATGVQTLDVPQHTCPSDPNSDRLYDEGVGEGLVRPVNYGFNFGTWFVFDPKTGRFGDGCFHPDAKINTASISDGLSNTLAAAEVKTFQALVRNTASPGPDIPLNVASLSGMVGGAQFELGQSLNQNGGHVEWCDGPVHESGMTSTFGPNTFVKYEHTDGYTYDIDFNSRYEGTSATEPTYAAITARSYHPGLVNALYMDGSVHSTNDDIELVTWRALSTRRGGEITRQE